tara:strand:- start:1805 stop:3409 length:1605 start_codon:yes stop_codon:yes gene_type:complete
MNQLESKNKFSFIIHPILFSVFPIIFIFSENIHLLPFTEIIFPSLIMIVITSILLFIISKKITNKNRIALVISLLVILFFSYGHFFNVLNDSLDGSDIVRHRYILIPFLIVGVIGSIYFVRSNRVFNNATTISNVIAVSLFVIISINIMTDFSNGNFFGSPQLSVDERFLGVGASEENLFQNIFQNDDNIQSPNKIDNITLNPDIYYIILDEYPNVSSLKQFFNFDNSKFIGFLESNNFYVAKNGSSNFPTTVQSLTSSLNMDYLNKLTISENPNSKNFQLLNELLSKNIVMKKLDEKGYRIFNVGSLWGPNGEFEKTDVNKCEYKEANRDSLVRELLETSMISYFHERYSEQLRRDRILCSFEEIEKINQESMMPNFVFVHMLLPHPPYIFGPNGEHVTPGNSSSGVDWNEREAHIDQVKFANKKLMELIPELLNSKNKPIIILQGDTGSGFELDWENPTKEMIQERLGNFNAVYFPSLNYNHMYETITPVNTFRIIFNEYFDDEYELLEDINFWSQSDKPYQYIDVTNMLND